MKYRDIPTLPNEKMPEVEVSLRIAFFLIVRGLTSDDVEVVIDGAQIKTAEKVHFQISNFLTSEGWQKIPSSNSWQGECQNPHFHQKVRIHSKPGKGDVVVTLNSGKRLRVESKKGPLVKTKGSQEYPLLRGALGQVLTVEEATEEDLFAVAVPESPRFQELAAR